MLQLNYLLQANHLVETRLTQSEGKVRFIATKNGTESNDLSKLWREHGIIHQRIGGNHKITSCRPQKPKD